MEWDSEMLCFPDGAKLVAWIRVPLFPPGSCVPLKRVFDGTFRIEYHFCAIQSHRNGKMLYLAHALINIQIRRKHLWILGVEIWVRMFVLHIHMLAQLSKHKLLNWRSRYHFIQMRRNKSINGGSVEKRNFTPLWADGMGDFFQLYLMVYFRNVLLTFLTVYV